jgi:hypothetical protein
MHSVKQIVLYHSVLSQFATRLRVALPLVLLFVTLSARADEQRAAILHPIGEVTVNDVAAIRPIPVLVGDQISTGHGATATIISEGSQVAMPADSTIVYTNRQVMVLRNSAVITTLTGMTARTGALTISPVSHASASQFEITRGKFGTKVTAATGSVAIADSTGSVELAAGNSVVRDPASQPSGISSASKIPAPKDPLFGVSGDKRKQSPPRRCPRPPESPTHRCRTFHDGHDDQADFDDHDGGDHHGKDPDPDRDCRCRDHDQGFQP